MKMPKISVVMPVYNTPENFLRLAINSILNQTIADLELIIVNDGSQKTDVEGTVSSYQDDRIHYFYQDNLGAGVARNYGMKKATGDYLYFMDSDDSLDTNALKELHSIAEENGADVVFFNLVKTPETGIKKTDFHFKMTTPSPCTKLFKRSFIQKFNLQFENLKSCNDLTFTYTAMALAKNVWKINKAYYYYNQENPNSISKSRGKNSDCLIFAMNALKENLQKHNIYKKFLNDFNDTYIGCVNYELEHTENKKSFLSKIKKENKYVYDHVTKKIWFGKEKRPNGHRCIYLFGVKILSYHHKKKNKGLPKEKK